MHEVNPTADQTLAEMRKLNSRFDELSLQIRIDTAWVRVREHVRYAVSMLSEIPIMSRLCIFAACVLMSIAMMTQSPIRKRLMIFAVDCLSLALVVVVM
jgi:hypothetical protein